ncbi:MAG: phosphotriesterase-related protein [Chloroflexi bacterium]|nr:phosphotriesterase-related protein [Chloroflexota bacterium]
MPSELTGKAQTVLGPIAPEALGVTMTHEHVLIDFRPVFIEPAEATARRLAQEPVRLENLHWIRTHQASNLDNLMLMDETVAVDETLRYRWAGGATIVEATSIGIGRDPLGLARVARATGLNIIMGAGYYVATAHPRDMDRRSEDAIFQEIVRDIRVGVGDTGVRAGHIGELGCSWPLADNERKVLRAAARAQRETGAPILIHPGRDESAPLEIMEVLREAGADVRRTVMGHIERTIFNPATLRRLAGTGCYLEYDLFGQENSYYPFNPSVYMPNDIQRMEQLAQLIAWGHLDQLVIAHDICMKIRLVRYGGHGYAHILENIVPRMRARGFTEQQIRAILVENPRRVLTFA